MSDRRPAIGEVFAGRFELRAPLLETTFARGYEAHDRDVDETVALLLLTREAEVVERLRARVRLIRRVTHRNVARAYDMGEHEGQYFLTMEYVDGVRLGAWIATQPSLGALLDVAAQLVEGLSAAHAADVIHANLTPFHVMVEASGRAVIGNFGVARFEAAETVAQVSDGAEDLLRSAVYLAPEQITGQAPTRATDIYGFGLLLFEMLTGEPRFAGEHAVVVANARLDDDLGDLSDPTRRDERVPPALAQLLERCLAREPDERPRAAELAAALRQLQRQLNTTGDTGPVLAGASTERTGERRHESLAVLPFRYRGPRESDYLAEALLDELVDLLSQTSGLRVLATGATAGLTGAHDRDPRRLGEQLGVCVIVDGTILLAGERLRISARLLEVADGFQLWHERFEGDVADVFELQDRLAKRIAEALRVELDIIAQRHEVDAAAIESYLRGRQAHLRWRTHGPDGAVAHYRAALERAPTFQPARAHLAMATVLTWFQQRGEDGTDWAEEARVAVERARALAPELPETWLAASNLALQRGEFRDFILHANEALRIAPTFALAHEFLGRVLYEIGSLTQGKTHLELAIELDPALSYCYADLARERVYSGDLDGFADYAARLRGLVDHHKPSAAMLHMRVGAWIGDEELIELGLSFLPENSARTRGLRRFGELLLAPRDDTAIEVHHIRQLALASSPRMRTLVEQLTAEQAAYHRDYARAMDHIEAASGHVLLDIEWLERCPVLGPLRDRARFAAVLATVRQRCQLVWAHVDNLRGR